MTITASNTTSTSEESWEEGEIVRGIETEQRERERERERGLGSVIDKEFGKGC